MCGWSANWATDFLIPTWGIVFKISRSPSRHRSVLREVYALSLLWPKLVRSPKFNWPEIRILNPGPEIRKETKIIPHWNHVLELANIPFQNCRHTAALLFHLINEDTNEEIYDSWAKESHRLRSTRPKNIAPWSGATSDGARSAQNLAWALKTKGIVSHEFCRKCSENPLESRADTTCLTERQSSGDRLSHRKERSSGMRQHLRCR